MKCTHLTTVVLAAIFGAAIGASLVRPSGALLHPGTQWYSLDDAFRMLKPFLVAGVLSLVLFNVYWEIAARSAAPAKSTESQTSRNVHVALLNVGFLLELLPIRGLGRYVAASHTVMAAGLAIELLGIGFAIWSRLHLGRNWSGAIAIKVEHQLIRSGPYRRLRHPIYTGLLTMYAGLALLTGEWLGLVGLTVVIVAYWRKIRLEEAALDEAFGSDYSAYRRESWALLPGLY